MFGGFGFRFLGRVTLAALVVSSVLAAQGNMGIDVAFVMDGSGSIDPSDFALQKQGLMTAVQDSQLVPRDGTIAVSIIQFAGGTTRIEVPYTLINSQADVSSVSAQIASIVQIGGCTNPGDGIQVATSVLNASGRPMATQSICLSTDGVPNCGSSLSAAVQAAQNSPIAIDTFGVLGIECPGFFGQVELQSVYAPEVFGGGAAVLVSGSVEFANTVGPACFGAAVRLVGLEAVQVVQDWDDTIGLTESKTTYVRAHLEPVDPMVMQTIAQARLVGMRNGSELPGSPLTAINPGGRIVARPDAAMRRGNFADSLNFRLPSSWLSGTVTLTLEGLGSSIECMESADTDEDCSVAVTFTSVDIPRIKFVAVTWDDGMGTTYTPTAADLTRLRDRLVATTPSRSVNATTGALQWTGAVPPDLAILNSRLESMRFWDFCWSFLGCRRIYYGALTGPDQGGLANDIPGTVSSGTIQNGTYGENRHTHEIAHDLGIRHVANCGCGSGDGQAPTFPYCSSVGPGGITVATLGPMGMGPNAMVYGLDTNNLRVVDPNNTFELMSYCGRAFTTPFTRWRWPSKFTYDNLRTAIDSTFAVINHGGGPVARRFRQGTGTQPPLGPPQEYLVVRGAVDLLAKNVDFSPFGIIESAVPPPMQPPGDYLLELRDRAGLVVTSVDFAPTVARADAIEGGGGEDDPGIGSFIIPVPNDNAICRAVVLRNGSVVGDRTASNTAPEVVVTFPNGGESLPPGIATLEWTSTDLDGDGVFHTVQYSADGGATWTTLTIDWPETSLDVDLGFLPATIDGRIRVFGSDGFHSSVDDSDGPFSAPNNNPDLQITSPLDGDEFSGVQTISLAATANDVEDGELSDVQWSSNVDGLLGSGQELTVLASDLSEGEHVITAQVTDSGGGSATDLVAIAVDTIFVEGCTLVTFEADDQGPLVNGQVPVFTGAFTLSSGGSNFGPAVFDSSPTGPNQSSSDPDLLVGLGNVLILQEHGTQSLPGIFDEPDDARVGGVLYFDFNDPVRVEALDLIDICPGPNQDAFVVLIDAAGLTRVYHAPPGWTSDVESSGTGFRTLDLTTLLPQPGDFVDAVASEDPGFEPEQTVRLEVEFHRSGAMDNLRFCNP